MFNLHVAKSKNTFLESRLKRIKKQSPKTNEDQNDIEKVLYVLAVGNLIYTMICTKLDIAHAIEVVNSYMTHSKRMH